MLKKFTLVVLLGLVLTVEAQARRAIRGCGGQGTAEVEKAMSFLDQNISSILSHEDLEDFTEREKLSVQRKLAQVHIKCRDERRDCTSDEGTLGLEKHPFNRVVVICYDRILESFGDEGFCNLAETIFHEIGHSADVPYDLDHNNGPNNDKVYRLGSAAASRCLDLSLGRPLSPRS